MTSTPTASATPTRRHLLPAFDALAHILRQLAGLTELPFPMMIRRDLDGVVVIHVECRDLPRWVILLDLPAPEWDMVTSEDGARITRHAVWSDLAFEGLPFRIACQDTVDAFTGATS